MRNKERDGGRKEGRRSMRGERERERERERGDERAHLEQLCVEVPGYGLDQVDGSLGRVVGGPDLPQVAIDCQYCCLDGIQVVGSVKLLDGKLFHQWVVVIHLFLGLLQTCMYMHIHTSSTL